MSQNLNSAVAIGIDIGKDWFHIVGLDYRGAIVSKRLGSNVVCGQTMATWGSTDVPTYKLVHRPEDA